MPNASVLEQKKAVVAELIEKLKSAQAGVIVDYRGLTVEEDTKLRTKLREAGVEYKVIKNTLTRFAIKEVGYEEMDEALNGPSSLAISETVLGADGVCRVHGGGFAGTIQAFVKNEKVEEYKATMDKVFGKGSCHVLKIRKYGGMKVL